MDIPDKASEAAMQALFEDGCGEPKVDASTVLEAAYKFIAAQAWDDGARIAVDHTLLAQAGVQVDDLRNPYRDAL